MKKEILVYLDDADKDKALLLAKALRRRKIRVKLVKLGDYPERRWAALIESAAVRAKKHILLLSSNTIDEHGDAVGVIDEVLKALAKQSPDPEIIPVRVEERAIWDDRLLDLAWIDLDVESDFERLISALLEDHHASDGESSVSVGSAGGGNDVSLVLAWDPDILTPDEYADLVTALGDLARGLGAAGIERVSEELTTIGVRVGVGVRV